jgi:pimeloyl-ACP methyl ester carboxylesterase
LRQFPEQAKAVSESVQMSGLLHGSGHIASRWLKQAIEKTPIISGTGFAEVEAARFTVSDFADMPKLRTFFKWPAPFPNPGPDWDFIGKVFGLLGSPNKPKSAAAADFFASNPAPDNPAANPVCLQKLLPYSIEFDARAGGLDLYVPYFVIQGRDDPRCPPEAARAFVDQVHAPAKNFTAIDGGHFACLSNPTGCLNALDSDIQGLEIKR